MKDEQGYHHLPPTSTNQLGMEHTKVTSSLDTTIGVLYRRQ
jgi:hypothetical protein